MFNSTRLRRRIFCLLYVLCILSALALCLSSCTATRHTSTRHSDISTTHQADTLARHARADTARTAHFVLDTLILRDTIRVSELRRGDTVYVDRYHTRSLIQRVAIRDTIFQAHTDTLHLATTEQQTSATMQTSSNTTQSSGGPPWAFVLFMLFTAYVMYKVISKE